MPHSLLIDGLGGGGYFDANDMSGGERVRLCNPCVPDPNTAPPQSPNPQTNMSPRSTHQRSRSNIGSTYGTLSPSNRHGAVFAAGTSGDPYRYLTSRTRSITMVSRLVITRQGVVAMLIPHFRDHLLVGNLLGLYINIGVGRTRPISSVCYPEHRLPLPLPHTQAGTVRWESLLGSERSRPRHRLRRKTNVPSAIANSPLQPLQTQTLFENRTSLRASRRTARMGLPEV